MQGIEGSYPHETAKSQKKGVLRSEESSAPADKPDDDQEDIPERGEPVMLSPEHCKSLRELGGSMEEHVARAIDRYLFMLQSKYEFTGEDYLLEESDQDCID